MRHGCEVGGKRVMGTGRDGNFKILKWKILRSRAGGQNVRKYAVHEVEGPGGRV